MKRFAIGLLLFLFVVVFAAADQCHHAQQVAVVPVAGVIQVPVYAAVYAPPQQSQDLILQEILAELRAMRAELQALRNPQQALALSNVAPVLKTNCAKCHAAAVADKDGGGFILLDSRGELAALSDRDRQRVVNRVSRNSMPPAPAKIDAAAKEAIVKAFEKK